ncbi:unnamed protein product [Mytilus edulis]|uniref:Fibronectin type-III domain-containing protein n=1 Tax=Mytilus edulis TaxID=6550 RepID=A0A8S3V5Q0_MYTED|nr:unnamed protein product [Mytilus edulis]
MAAPSGFEVVECSDCSITIAWDKNVQDNCLGYELRHRVPGTDNWEVTKFSTTDVSSDKSGRCMYTLLDISPDTGYEIKLCSVDTNGNSQFTESKTKQTLKRAPSGFEVVECSDCSITIAWDKNVQDNCLGYELRHRVPGPDNWEVTKFSTTDVSSDKSGRCMYTLLNISPDTGYEIKLCSVDTNGSSQFTESKTKQTLKRAPSGFEVVECSDCSTTIAWDKKVQDNCLGYELCHRVPGTDNWEVTKFSTTDVSSDKTKRCMYTLLNILPDTGYEIKLCSVDANGNSQFTESKTKQTLKRAPSGFEVVECSDCSITIAWDKNVQDNCLGYELRHRVPGPDNWEVTKFSTTDVSSDKSGRCVYTLLNISPDTGYEIKLCSVDTNGNSQFTESKTKQTLKRGNKTFDLLFLLMIV